MFFQLSHTDVQLAALTIGLVLALVALWRERRGRRAAESAALSDSLTSVPNRLAFEQRLDVEWDRAQRYGRPFAVLVIDLDGFKQINDRRGHTTGDRVLRVVAQQMLQRVRATDMLARIGGDEFAVILPETSALGACQLRQALREEVHGPVDSQVGLSIGVAEFSERDDCPLAVVERADAAMYEHKREQAAA